MGGKMKKTVAELYQDMAEIGLEGWINDFEGETLRQEIEKLEPGQTYLEVGVAFGKSLSTMCYYAKEGVNILGLDILNWEHRDNNMQKLGVGGRAQFIEGDSQQIALEWNRTWNKNPIDLLFIDGDHTYYGIVKDLLSWIPNVKPGGRIMLHDYDETSPGVMRAVHDFIFPHPAYSTESPTKPNTIYRFTKL